jgi:hypothetical protein
MILDPEDEAFNEIERQAKQRKEAVLQALHSENERLGLYRDAYGQQEPVAYLSNKRQRLNIELKPHTFVEIPTATDWEVPLYMKPPQRTWVGLTDADIAMWRPRFKFSEALIREVEAKLKEKNNA